MTHALGDRFLGHDGLVHAVDKGGLWAINAGRCGAGGNKFFAEKIEDMPRTEGALTCFRCLVYGNRTK